MWLDLKMLWGLVDNLSAILRYQSKNQSPMPPICVFLSFQNPQIYFCPGFPKELCRFKAFTDWKNLILLTMNQYDGAAYRPQRVLRIPALAFRFQFFYRSAAQLYYQLRPDTGIC